MNQKYLVLFDFDGWKLVQVDDFGNMTTLLREPDFETLIRHAVGGGYLRIPIAIKLGEMP